MIKTPVETIARVGVDIGGTFTDVVLEVGPAQYTTKVLTSYAAPEEGIIEGITGVCAQAGISPKAISQLVHGTTLATNALIERRGANTAFITTRGFRDVIEMRTESRFEQYDLNLTLPEPLLTREHRYVLDERVAANGDILRPLGEDAVHDLVPLLRAGGYDSIAVGFIHSYANDIHELKVRRCLEQALPGALVSLSCEVSPQMREYERFNTVVANAYIKPMMKSYLDRLRDRLRGIGLEGAVFLMHSGGGIISLENAAAFPVRLVESGPAGGAVFAADIAARHGLNDVLSFDMGGTTAKICLIKNHTPNTSRVFEVARSYRFKKGSGMPISIPVIDMVEIGAGGGSLAHIDTMRQIRVGPQSAGSEPGPACYNRGGVQPAVTDADLLLGRLDPDKFAGGSIALNLEQAEDAIKNTLADELSLDAALAAFGVSEVVDENMANAARVHGVENGEDLEGYTMIAFGGAAPLHAGRLCEKLGIVRLLVPPGAGVGSAIGFLRAPFSYEATKSLFMTLSAFDRKAAQAVLRRLADEAVDFVKDCGVTDDISLTYKIYMRYRGQGSDIPVLLPAPIAEDLTAPAVQSLFEAQYKALFGRTVDGMDIEITVWAVNGATSHAFAGEVKRAAPGGELLVTQKRPLFDPGKVCFTESGVIARQELTGEKFISGPCIITEDETSIIVPARGRAVLHEDGCIEITLPTSRGIFSSPDAARDSAHLDSIH